MAERLVFVTKSKQPFHEERSVKFKWVAGQALSKKRECASNLVSAAAELHGLKCVMEISRASDELGQQFSAFRLRVRVSPTEKPTTVEVVYQNSKVWAHARAESEFVNYSGSAFDAKKRANLRREEGGKLRDFCVCVDGREFHFDLEPKDAFYNWLYIKALRQKHNERLVAALESRICQECRVSDLRQIAHLGENCRIGFTDVFFNPQKGKQYNCQARALAQYISLRIYHPEQLDRIFPPHEESLSAAGDLEESFRKYVEFVHEQSPDGSLDLLL
ncbi:MAG: hypothetical protein WHS44_03495 [Fimbriimonadales bacterium]|nr:MAG: hypothetical protein KatS3mg018_1840 [Fimbriimonadales bacterium]